MLSHVDFDEDDIVRGAKRFGCGMVCCVVVFALPGDFSFFPNFRSPNKPRQSIVAIANFETIGTMDSMEDVYRQFEAYDFDNDDFKVR